MKTFVYRRSKLLRRIGAVFIDFIISLCFFVFFFVLINEPIVKKTQGYQETYQSYETILLDSGLYVKDNDKGLVIIKSNYDEHFIYFYSNYDSIDTYNSLKSDSECFTFDEINNVFVEVGSEEEMDSFYVDTLHKAYNILVSKEEYIIINQKLETYSMIMTLPSMCLGVFCAFLLPSLIFKSRKTIGMMPFHLSFISSKSGEKAEKMQLFFRFLLFFFFEFLLTIINGIGLVFIIVSAVYLVFNQRKQSLIDLACQTIIVDDFPQGQVNKSDEIIIVLEKEKSNEE